MAGLKGLNLKGPRFSLSDIRQTLRGLEGSGYYFFIALLVLIVIIFMGLTNSLASKREQRVERKRAELNEFMRLANDFKNETASIEHLRAKLQVRDTAVSAGSIMEEIGAELGIQKNITSFKPLEEEFVSGYMKKGVLLNIEGVTLNQAINLLYRIRTHKLLLLIKNFSMKAHFMNPGLLDLTVQVVLVTRQPAKR